MQQPESPPTPSLWTTTLLVKNIHCPSCVSYAEDVLRPLPNIHKMDISIIDHAIRVQHSPCDQIAQRITQELQEAAFEIEHVVTRDVAGRTHHQYERPTQSDGAASPSAWPWNRSMSKAERKHIENCNACRLKISNRSRRARRFRQWLENSPQQTDLEKAESTSSVKSSYDVDEKEPAGEVNKMDTVGTDQWTANIGIEGMTCASCVGTITNILEPIDYVDRVNINLLANNGIVQFSGPRSNLDLIIETIEDAGYNASVLAVHNMVPPSIVSPVVESNTFRLALSIDGMTCSACVGTITRGLKEFHFVSTINIDLLSNKGVIDFDGVSNKSAILEKFDDLGYDAAELSCERLNDQDCAESGDSKYREATITVEGTYCPRCPDNIANALEKRFGTSVTIIQLPNQKLPHLKVSYTAAPPTLTIRHIIATINEADESFSASVHRALTDEERSSRIRRRHRNEILGRLVLVAIMAIPTFIIGIVYMSLVPKTSQTRQWFEQPVWAGNVTREEWALFIMTTPVYFFAADHFHSGALKDIRSLWRRKSKVPILRRFYRFGSMNLLISLGTTVAYFSSLAVLIMDAVSSRMAQGRSSDTYFDSVTFLTLFLLIGRFLEAYTKAKTGDAVNMLAGLKPSEAYLVDAFDDRGLAATDMKSISIVTISTDLLEPGDIVSVPHGNSPPSDGTINQEGAFLFDESSLTGESKPVKKVLGDRVFAGSINVSQPVQIRVTELGSTSMLDKIVAVVREGQGKRAPIERIADVITGYFAPAVTLIAIVTWVIWLGLGEGGVLPRDWLDVQQGGWAFWSLEFAIAVFVVACPCGIGLAAPTALYVGGGLAARNHILVQGGGEAFQEASNMDVIVFDKTGTLTEGKMQVTNFDLLQDPEEKTLALAMSKALEDSSTHPIATAISSYCSVELKDPSRSTISVSDIREISGCGMKGAFTVTNLETADIMTYEATLGNQRFAASPDNPQVASLLTKYQNLGQSVAILSIRRVAISDNFVAIAVFSISDPLRTTTASVIYTLQHDHNLSVHMCTGDNATTARSMALQAGIPIANIRANVLPHEKAEYIRSLQEEDGKRKIVAFVGDGTNDTPALAAADVSIALSSGSDVAITQASFILLNSDLETILRLVKLAKRVFWRVKMNFVWAAVYNVCLIPVAAGVTFPAGRWRLGPVWASAAMAASSVSVVCSSLALKLPEMELEKLRFWKS